MYISPFKRKVEVMKPKNYNIHPGIYFILAAILMTKVDSLISSDPAIQTHTAIQGFSFLGGQGS